jgi:RHS repeat-associated protein
VSVTRTHIAYLVNNIITGNGTASGTTGGRFGVTRESSTSPQTAGITLFNNLICGNRLGEINGPALDATDANNLTPTGAEGLGVVASAGCAATATVYDHLVGPDGVVGTGDDDFRLATGSPALDKGMDPRTLGLPASFNALFETDFTGVAGARPQNATGASSARFDIGAFEANPPDTTAPTVTFQDPAVAGAYVRGTIPVTATATDAGSGVATFTLAADGQNLTATLTPTVPPPAASVVANASWNTATVPDGTHTLAANATDAANNTGTATRFVIVDNTPPETTITDGPSGEISVSNATFSYSGSDNLTPAALLVFAWRLDGGPWTGFGAATTASLTGLTEGAHTFEVKARDLALNEDLTPAARTFTVRFGPSITDVSPASGTIGTLVTITGTNFEPGATTVTFNGLAAVVRTVSPTVITTTVPVGTATGPLVVVTSRGSASRTFTVTQTGDFAVAASPLSVRAIAGDQGSAHVTVTGSGSFTNLVAPTVTPAVTGITATFGAPYIAPGASTPLTFRVDGSVAAGTYAFMVAGSSSVDGRTITHTTSVSLEVLPADTHAVTGRIMTAESVPLPIPGVSVVLGSAFVLTDAGGNFILQAPPAGPNMLFVDGRTASVTNAQFPIIETQITVSALGPTRVPFTIYLPKLDNANAVNLPVDSNGFTTVETKVTTPAIPGLEVTVPLGTRIVGPDGNPVAQLVITPVPVDRSPMPFPAGKAFPFLFAINPGGSVPSNPLPISFPNAHASDPGTKADLYYFDLAIGNWNVWGTGTVSADGKQVISDPGFGLPRLAWHSECDERCQAGGAPGEAPPACNKPANTASDPVDLFTGRLNVAKTDVILPGRIPIRIQRTYWSGLTRSAYFGIGWSLETYDVKLASRGTALALIQADQAELLFVPDGTGRWVNILAPYMAGAVITQLPGDFIFQLRFKDGTTQRFDRIVGFANVAALSSITDRNGNTLAITRINSTPTSFGQITRITEPAGRHIDLDYDTAGRIKTITDPLGRTVRYTYDSQGRLENVFDQAGGITTYTYDTAHRITSITDPRHITYQMNEYDASGRVIRQTQADGGVWQFDYSAQGNLITQTTVTDPRNSVTAHRFNSLGFVQSVTDALGQTTTYTYSATSNLLIAITDPLGRVSRFDYDGNGNVTKLTDSAGLVRTFTYDPTFNKVVSAGNSVTPPTLFTYDTAGLLTAITDPRGKMTAISYNGFGQPLTVNDPLNQTTVFTYDNDGNLASIADPFMNTTRFEYDTVGRRIRATDPRGKLTQFEYDALNRLVGIVDAVGARARFDFDGNGNLLTMTDSRNNTISYAYDNMDRPATRRDQLNVPESFVYDTAGNLIQRTDRKGQVSNFVYDALNQKISARYVDGAVVNFTYDAGGRLIGVTDSVGGTVTSSYDSEDRLVAQMTQLGSVTYQYDLLGRRIMMQLPAVAATTYGYDDGSRLRQIVRDAQRVNIDYDDVGRRTLLTLPNGVTTEYQYDVASRLIGLIYRNGGNMLGNLLYGYDAAGNRTRVGGSLARVQLPDAVATATYDEGNRQRQFGDRDMAFDANGNVTAIASLQGLTTLTWDSRDRLVALQTPDTLATLSYVFGRRMAKTVNGRTTEYVYDGFDVAQEIEGDQLVTHLRSLTVDELLGLTTNDATFYVTKDAIGSTVSVTSNGGNVIADYTYDPFGSGTTTNPTLPNAAQFTGRENDRVAGLYYYRARYYQPSAHRFVSEDPIGSPAFTRCTAGYRKLRSLRAPTGSSRGDLANLYAYVQNRPTVLSDPSGLGQCEDELGDCLHRAGAAFFECRKQVFQISVAAVAACVPICVIAAPGPLFVGCFALCEGAAASAAGAGLAACGAIAWTQRGICSWQYGGCKEQQGEQIGPLGPRKDIDSVFPNGLP